MHAIDVARATSPLSVLSKSLSKPACQLVVETDETVFFVAGGYVFFVDGPQTSSGAFSVPDPRFSLPDPPSRNSLHLD